MKLDLENITESARWFDARLFLPYYQSLGKIQHRWLRIGAPLVGLGDGCISSLQAVSGLGEALLKGSANTAKGIWTRDRTPLLKGILQISLGGGAIALASIPLIAIRTARIAAQVAYDPASSIAYQQRKLQNEPQQIRA